MPEMITPPASKIGGAPEPTPTPEITPTPEVTPAPTDKKKGAIQSIGERADAAMAAEKEKQTQATKAAADKKTADAAVAAADDSDEALNKEIDETTKNWQPGEKKAFTKKTYELRDLKRQIKEADAKVADADTLRTKIAAYEKQLTQRQSESPATNTKQIDDLKESIKQLTQRAETAEQAAQSKEQELAVTAVERSEAYQKTVTLPTQAIENKAKELAKKYDVPERLALSALHGTSDEQVEAASSFNEADKIVFFNLAAKLGDVNERADVLRSNAKEALDKMAVKKSQESEVQTSQKREARAAAHKDNWKQLQEAVPILTPAEGDDEATKTWNQHLTDADKWSSDTEFETLDIPTQSKVKQRAAVFPMLVGAIGSYQAQLEQKDTTIKTLQEEITKYRGSKPNAEVTPRDPTNPEADPLKDEKDFVKRTSARLQAAGF